MTRAICRAVLWSFFLIILAWSHFTLLNIASMCDVKPFVLLFFFSLCLVLSVMKPSPQRTASSSCWEENKSCHSLISPLHTAGASLPSSPLNPALPLAGLFTATEKRGTEIEGRKNNTRSLNFFVFRLLWDRSIFIVSCSVHVLVDRELIMIPLSSSSVICNIIFKQANLNPATVCWMQKSFLRWCSCIFCVWGEVLNYEKGQKKICVETPLCCCYR